MFTYKIDEEVSLKLIEHKDAEELFYVIKSVQRASSGVASLD